MNLRADVDFFTTSVHFSALLKKKKNSKMQAEQGKSRGGVVESGLGVEDGGLLISRGRRCVWLLLIIRQAVHV